MDQVKIMSVVRDYKALFVEKGVSIQRIETSCKFSEVSEDAVLAHAHHLVENIINFIDDKRDSGKIHRHFAALQMCLSFAGWYSLDDLMNHNRP